MCQPVINPAGRVRELSPSSPVVPSGAPQFGSWLPSPLPSRELAPGYRGAGRNIWVSWPQHRVLLPREAAKTRPKKVDLDEPGTGGRAYRCLKNPVLGRLR